MFGWNWQLWCVGGEIGQWCVDLWYWCVVVVVVFEVWLEGDVVWVLQGFEWDVGFVKF